MGLSGRSVGCGTNVAQGVPLSVVKHRRRFFIHMCIKLLPPVPPAELNTLYLQVLYS